MWLFRNALLIDLHFIPRANHSCSKGCIKNKRKRREVTRDVGDQEESTNKIILTVGPVVFEAAKEDEPLDHQPSQSKQTALIGGVAGAGGFGLVAIVALVVLLVKFHQTASVSCGENKITVYLEKRRFYKFKANQLHSCYDSSAYGTFTFKMDFFTSSSFATPYTAQDYPLTVDLSEYVYLQYIDLRDFSCIAYKGSRKNDPVLQFHKVVHVTVLCNLKPNLLFADVARAV
ncbi:hypothetical protein pdam_00007660 [Pocillopora damicornis]|uniref:Uncharacterized protein n=1 Tax=Pocillopora damicornis TaxID=46731 RepID=A0A3M6TZD9_POCDA|nr:hypothetical protein pdam_00007660 [Pocillopora damicornis]